VVGTLAVGWWWRQLAFRTLKVIWPWLRISAGTSDQAMWLSSASAGFAESPPVLPG
jgi:hypothetical protein